MSVFEKWSRGIKERNADALIDCLHDDYRFVRHQSGTTMNKSQTGDMLRALMSNNMVTVNDIRCLYENEDVYIEHSVINFPDGSKEAVLCCYQLKDGLIIECETGATPIKE
jgi:hypothetical protein